MAFAPTVLAKTPLSDVNAKVLAVFRDKGISGRATGDVLLFNFFDVIVDDEGGQ